MCLDMWLNSVIYTVYRCVRKMVKFTVGNVEEKHEYRRPIRQGGDYTA